MKARRLASLCSLALVATAALGLIPAPAQAAPQTAEPAVLNIGWWWKQAQSEEQDIQGNKVTVDSPSPFCPAVPGSLGVIPGACAEGTFPVQIVGGDYEEPDMLSGLGFDLSILTPGSEVTKFEVTLLESEAGCVDKNGDGVIDPQAGDYCQDTDPKNIEGKKVQACLLTQIFGDADGRPYREVPTYKCSSADPVAERKEIKAVDKKDDTDGFDHVWKFDLTAFAQEWAESFTIATSVMLVGSEPKETGSQDSWRVVFAGPKAKKGIVTKLVYEPGELPAIAPIVPPSSVGSTGSFTGSAGGTSFSGGGADFGGGTGAVAGGAPGTAPSPGASPGGLAALAEEIPDPENMPAYVWIALVAGLIGFTLVRQVVIESTHGVRPDGVLSKIHSLNAERRGLEDAAQAAVGPSPLAGLGAVAASFGRAFSSFKSRLPFGGRG